MKPNLIIQKIIMVSKGWYDKTKYCTVLHAMTALISDHVGVELKYITIRNVLFWLDKAFDELDMKDKYKIILYRLCDDFYKRKKSFTPEDICYEMVSELCDLNIRDDNGNWIVDISDVDNVKCIV